MRVRTMQKIALSALALTSAGCSDDSDTGEVSLQLASHNAASNASASAGQLVITAGEDEIALAQVGLVLRKVRLDGPPTASCPEDAEGDSRCAELDLGPVLFDLPIELGAEGILNAVVPIGSYTGLRFQLHRPTDAGDDADFVAEHPEFEGISIRVLGSYNGVPFTFTSDLTVVEDVDFDGPVEVDAEEGLPVTLLVEVAGWFAGGDGGLVDPAQANDGGALEAQVEQQIRASFKAFGDSDGDGSPD
jgi:hypothetical protein